MLYINVPDMNDSLSSITLDEKEYLLRFTYNEKFDYWNFGIYEDEDTPIVAMTKIVPNFPCLDFCRTHRLPNGVFGCLSDSERVGRQSFNNKTAEFVFISNEELEELEEE